MGANQVGRNHAGLRKRMALFARLRSARRAMPAAAVELTQGDIEEQRTTQLRETLSELAAKEAPAKQLAQELNARLGSVDRHLNEMCQSLFDRFDGVSFAALRAAIPRSLESHPKEVVALLEVLLGDATNLPGRLQKVEYLITMLATEEEGGIRRVVLDPVGITPALENFSVESFDAAEAEAIAAELLEAATLESETEDISERLIALRSRKQSLGLGCLCPSVLRSVVTYNARMFNFVESHVEASRVADASIAKELAAAAPETESAKAAPADACIEKSDERVGEASLEVASDSIEPSTPVSAPPRRPPAPVATARSVFDSEGLSNVIRAMRASTQGGALDATASEAKIAATLVEKNALEALEASAIQAESPNAQQDLVARTAIVGLMLSDVEAHEPTLEKLGISIADLQDPWVRELNKAFGKLLSGMVADPKAYEMSSQLSGIKTKHLLKPLKALNTSKRGTRSKSLAQGDGSAEMNAAARAAVEGPSERKPRTVRTGRSKSDSQQGFAFSFADPRVKTAAAAVLCAVALTFTLSNFIDIMPSSLKDLQAGSLRMTSPYLTSAQRNEKGRGDLLMGRVDDQFVALSIDDKIEAANEMVENFEIQGIREALIYDSRGTMQVQYNNGKLHRPRPGDRSTGHRPGEAAIRRTLSGERLDEVAVEDEPEKKIHDDWDDL